MARLLTTFALISRIAHRPLPPPQIFARHNFARRAILAACEESAAVDVDGLRKESQRVLYRAQKKVSKAEDRASACEAKQEALLNDENASLEDLEALPPCDDLRAAATAEAERLAQLEALVSGLQAAVAADGDAAGEESSSSLAELISLAKELGVNDKPPPRAAPRPKKQKGPRASKEPRLPYRVFRSENGAEIRVGKQAKDNDVLSTDPAHRDSDDWWMHAQGCPGSHVVIRVDSLGGGGSLPREVELDAAVLAANYSKAALTGTVGVSLCKARQVSKPFGAKPGLVQLSGDVKVVKVNWRKERGRLERLGKALD